MFCIFRETGSLSVFSLQSLKGVMEGFIHNMLANEMTLIMEQEE